MTSDKICDLQRPSDQICDGASLALYLLVIKFHEIQEYQDAKLQMWICSPLLLLFFYIITSLFSIIFGSALSAYFPCILDGWPLAGKHSLYGQSQV